MEKEKFIKIEKKYDKKHIRNKIIVNLITGLRSLGTIAIIPIFFSNGALITAISAAGFFITDCIDGFLARKLHVESFFGMLLDACSDKAFGIICLLLLSTLNPIFLIIIGLEIGIFTINYKSAQNNNNVKSSKAGKAKTVLLAATIVGSFFCYAAPSIKEVLGYVNSSILNSILETNPDILSSILALPTIGASLYVAKDYHEKAKSQEDIKLDSELKAKEIKIEEEITEIKEKRKDLLKQKEELKQLKSRQEILHVLFDTDFYLENKDAKLKSLIYKG